jgi:hypothetical protein
LERIPELGAGNVSKTVYLLWRWRVPETLAISLDGAYTKYLDLEDTLTARCAFAIEKISLKGQDVLNLRASGSYFSRFLNYNFAERRSQETD